MTDDSEKAASAGVHPGDGGTKTPAAESARKRREMPVAAMAEFWMFPGIVASMVLGNQPFPVAQWIGQGLNWASIATGCVVVLSAVRTEITVVGLMGAIVIAKVLRSTAMSGSADVLYITAVNVLFCVSGAVVAFRRPVLLYKQVMTIALVNLVFMVLQVVGVGAWTQLFTTHGEGNLTAPVRTLFVPEIDLEYLLVQGRPAGLSYSNIVLALIIAFATVLHLSLSKGKLWWGTAVISVMVVLCMSKFLLIVSPLVALWLMLTGTRPQRASAARALAGIAVALLVYCYAFPGLAATNLSVETVKTSFFLRLNDIGALLDPRGVLKERSDSLLEGTPRATWVEEGSFVSGYAQVMAKTPILVPTALLATLAYFIGLRSLRRRAPELAKRAFLVVCVVAAYPFTFPIWGLQMYWFMAGLGLLPLLWMLRPQFVEGNTGASEACLREIHGRVAGPAGRGRSLPS